ncbi:uncharacterized protein [Medicago truncatula]|uniref:Uncharacterized protein n=1 Tax=Medicago truncatula TaxID=3880 RepID=G7J487_MEDTR|nr:uncharacterized protein LOC120579719 [Medicago truncatula]AES71412.1 hypothetical protein MTR_3g076670 [Medicago truncatula]
MTVENKNIVSSSSSTPTELPLSFPPFNNLASMEFDPSEIIERLKSIPMIRTRPGQEDNFIGNQVDDKSTSEEEKEGDTIFNPIDLDGYSPSAKKCPKCNFDIEVSALLDCSEDQTYVSYTMICPVCHENLGEEAIRNMQSSSFPAVPKGIWKPWENSNVDWELHDKRDTITNADVPSQDNAYVPSFDDFFSDEDTISNASDVPVEKGISNGKSFEKDAPDTSDEHVQERSDRAAFAQELLISALFLD